MSELAELIPEAKSLSRADKLRLIQFLAGELASDEGMEIKANQSYAVWSPDAAFNAADIMLQALSKFFMEFDVCFFRSRSLFEVQPRT